MNIKDLPLHKRNICILANEETKKKIGRTDWIKLGIDMLSSNNLSFSFKKSKTSIFDIRKACKKEIPHPIFDIDEASNTFTFPPTHPRNGFAYATSVFDDNLYIPLSSFHKYMYQSKISAFIELCSSLGAKNCRIIYAEENKKEISTQINLLNIPTNIGIFNGEKDFNYNKNQNQNSDIFYSFPQHSSIKKYETKWMNGEPTWQTLQNIRLENDVEKYIAEFNYNDDMGITANIASSLNGMGINIGGKYEEFKKIKYKFEIEFCPK